MYKALLPLKLLADADMAIFGSKLIFYTFCPSCLITFPRHWAKERVVRKTSSPVCVTGMSSLLGEGECSAVMASEFAVRHREVPGNRGGPTGSLELRGKIGSRRGPKYPRRTLAGKRRGREKRGKGRLGVGLK